MARSFKTSKKGFRGRGRGRKGKGGKFKNFRVPKMQYVKTAKKPRRREFDLSKVPSRVITALKKMVEHKHIDLISVAGTTLDAASDNPLAVNWVSEADNPAAPDQNIARIAQGSGAHQRDGQVAHLSALKLKYVLFRDTEDNLSEAASNRRIRVIVVQAMNNQLDSSLNLRDVIDFSATDAYGAGSEELCFLNDQRFDTNRNYKILHDAHYNLLPTGMVYDYADADVSAGSNEIQKEVYIPLYADIKYSESTTSGAAGTVQNNALYCFAFVSVGFAVRFNAWARLYYEG